MQTLPRISVIMPSFRQAAYLEESIMSVIGQDYDNLEFILIDGGSEDGSVDIIKKHANRISYWVSEKDNGQSHAINKGLAKATGDIITWLCSDDTYLPGTLGRFAELYISNPDVGLFHGKSILFGKNRKEVVSGADRRHLELSYFSAIPFPQPSSFFTRKALEKTGFLDERLHYAMDYDLVTRIALHFPVLGVDEVFSRYRLHKNSKSVSQLSRFVDEWSVVFSRFLNSVTIPDRLRPLLEAYGLPIESEKAFKHDRQFSEKDLTTITCLYHYNALKIHYELLDKRKCLELISTIKETDPLFHAEYGLEGIRRRIEWIPTGLIRVFRKVRR